MKKSLLILQLLIALYTKTQKEKKMLWVSEDAYQKVGQSDIKKIKTFEDAQEAFYLRKAIQQSLQENLKQRKARQEMKEICRFILENYSENLKAINWVATHAELGSKERTSAQNILYSQ